MIQKKYFLDFNLPLNTHTPTTPNLYPLSRETFLNNLPLSNMLLTLALLLQDWLAGASTNLATSPSRRPCSGARARRGTGQRRSSTGNTGASIYLPIHLSSYLSICLSSSQLFYSLSIYPTFCLFIYLIICLSIYPSIFILTYLSIFLSIYISLHKFTNLSS